MPGTQTAAPDFILDRRDAVPALIGRQEDFLIVSGLAATSRDVAALTGDGAHTYTMAGAMRGASMIGLGLSLARPDKRVLVVTGDGELLMNVGALATIGVLNRRILRSSASTTVITARPGIRKATPASGSISKRSLPPRASRQRARSPLSSISPTAPASCVKATAPPLFCCA